MPRTKNHRTRTDTPARKSALLEMLREPLPPPDGCLLRTCLEKSLWATYLAARAPDDWRPVDLLTLYKIVKLEIQIRGESRLLDVEGLVVKQGSERAASNPRLSVLRQLQSLQLSLARSIKLNALATSAQVIASQAQTATKLTKTAHHGRGTEIDELLLGRV